MKHTDIENYKREVSTDFSILCELEKALNDEWLAYYQYWTAYTISRGVGKFDVDSEAKEHAEEEMEHIERLTKRICELGGNITLDPSCWTSKAHEWHPLSSCETLDIVKELKYAELTAIKNYEDIICHMSDRDPVTKQLLTDILSKEYEHYHDLELLCGSLV